MTVPIILLGLITMALPAAGEVTTIARGNLSAIERSRQVAVQQDADWHGLWRQHAPDQDPPRVDFATRTVIAVFLGSRNTAGYDVEITRVDRTPDGAIVDGTGRAALAVTRCSRRSSPPLFTSCPCRGSPAQSASLLTMAADSSTGLEPRTGAFLAYLAWWVTGALMLVLERRDSFVRFHAAQALVGLGAIWVLGAAVFVLAFAVLSISATGFAAMLWLALGIWAVGVGVWLGCLVKVFRGERWRMPLAARIADRISATRSSSGPRS